MEVINSHSLCDQLSKLRLTLKVCVDPKCHVLNCKDTHMRRLLLQSITITIAVISSLEMHNVNKHF